MAHRRYRHAWLGIALAACVVTLSAVPARAADNGTKAGEQAQTGIVVEGLSGKATNVTDSDLAQLAPVPVTVSFETEHGPRKAAFAGPLLWTVLVHAGAIDPAKPREQVRQAVLVTGRDGYTAVLALGEIAPEFEAKQVIVADRMDGQALGATHLRLVVPGDRRGGRSVRDLARITVLPPASAGQ